MKKTTVGIIVLIIIIILAFVLTSGEDSSQVLTPRKVDNSLVITPQEETDTVVIDKVALDKPGFIAVHEVINNKRGQVLEVSQYLEEGIHENVSIFLGGIKETKSLDESDELPISTELVAIVYVDDGDRGFNPFLDSFREVNGNIVARYIHSGDVVSNTVIVPSQGEETTSSVTVVYTDEGFSPKTVEIALGETVTFVNQSSVPMWVASDIHPTHDILPTFDQFGVSGFDESYKYTFDQRGTWEYHDHVNASKVGTIIVR